MQIFFIVNILLSLAIVGLVLVQHGKGADMGAGLGASAGASTTVFGSQGSLSFLFKITAALAILFFANCIVTTYVIGHRHRQVNLLTQSAPVKGAPAEQSGSQSNSAAAQPPQSAGVLPMQGTVPATQSAKKTAQEQSQ